ncbi:MAG TPA: 3-deoxy-D-manno-octulosonic acid transferase [Planctomycetota bacterium]|nr:3-deoxy-D-manno-octulosonic acid transferase [Planctomycetota bacterium]
MATLADGVYALLAATVGPFWWVRRRWKGKRSPPLGARLGRFEPPPPHDGPTAWFHAVSVGEALAARDLVRRVAEARRDARIVVTCTTAAGLDVARRAYPDATVLPSPLDFSFAVRRFLDALRPTLLTLVELELWPNLLAACGARGVPVLVANARVSERSFGRYRALLRVLPRFLDPVTTFLARGPEHAARLRALGAPEGRVEVAGDLKFDNAEPAEPGALRRRLRAEVGWADDDPVLVAGSTHPGEERAVVEAMRRVRRLFPRCRLVLAPRHLERTREVTALLSSLQFAAVRRSDGASASEAPCLLLDTTGELARWYAAGDVAFVGGSLAPIGGHNLLEPAVYGVPMITGPHLATVRDTARLFAEAGALVEVKDAEALADRVAERFASPDAARRGGAAARSVIAERRGAAARCAEAVLRELDRRAPRGRSA